MATAHDDIALGDTVIFVQAPHETPINGTREHPAVICRLWSEWVANLRVLTDGAAIEWRTSVKREDRAEPGQAHWRPREA